MAPIPIGIFAMPPPGGLGIQAKEVGHGPLAEFGRFLTSDAYRFLRWSRFLEL